MSIYILSVTSPWRRPQYKNDGSIINEVMIETDTSYFRNKLQESFLAEVRSKKLEERFPLIDEIAINIELHSRKRHKLPFVLKNVLDSLNKQAYTDDYLVSSICASQQYTDGPDRLSISIYPNKIISNCLNTIEFKPFLSLHLANSICDTIIPTRKSCWHSINQNEHNAEAIEAIEYELTANKKNDEILSSVSEVSVNIHTSQPKADIDNIAMLYFIGMDKILYEDISCIKRIILNIDRTSPNEYADINITV